MDFGEKLKKARGNKTLQQLSEITRIDASLLSKYEGGDHAPGTKNLKKIAEATGKPLSWFYEETDLQEVEPCLKEKGDSILINMHEVSAAAGAGCLNGTENIIGMMAFPKKYIRLLTQSGSDKLCIISVQGDSMSPSLNAGDLIMVDKGQADSPQDSIYVLRMDDALRVKRVQRIPGNVLRIKSDNQTLYEPVDVDLNKHQVEVLGRVIWYGRKI